MADYKIPIDERTPIQELETDLAGSLFLIKFMYNKREDRWYFDILNAESGDPVRSGIKVVSSYPMMNTFRDLEKRPLGEFFCIDSDSGNQDPTFEELGDTVNMFFSEF